MKIFSGVFDLFSSIKNYKCPSFMHWNSLSRCITYTAEIERRSLNSQRIRYPTRYLSNNIEISISG
ncbi:Ribosome association toxin RatA [Trichinella spiralis]|uniref:Ribosome association toxin RatA n=1 Tax=Trichinella spiralis TaxID=6334 RepID=A0ABR3KUR5_TRISP